MTLEERMNIIKNKAERDKEKELKAEKQKQDELINAIQQIQVLKNRIDDLLTLVNQCKECGIKLPNLIETQRYGYGDGRYGFFADRFTHHVGFINNKKQIKYIGIDNGGACGLYDFCTNGDEIFLKHEGDGTISTIKPVKIYYIKEFLREFDQFEAAFYQWIDSLSK